MEKTSIDSASMAIPPERLRRIFAEQLAYPTVPPRREMRPGSGDEIYSKVIAWIEDEHMKGEFEKQIQLLRRRFDSEMQRLKLNISDRYHVADPFKDAQVGEEIISRHIGWEIYFSLRSGSEIQSRSRS